MDYDTISISKAQEFFSQKNAEDHLFYLGEFPISQLNLGMNNKLRISAYIAGFIGRIINNKKSMQQLNYACKIIKMFAELLMFKDFQYPVTINPLFNNTTIVYDYLHPGLKRLALYQFLQRKYIKGIYYSYKGYTPLFLKNFNPITFTSILQQYKTTETSIWIHPLTNAWGTWPKDQVVPQINFTSNYYNDIRHWEFWVEHIFQKIKIYSTQIDLPLLSKFTVKNKKHANVFVSGENYSHLVDFEILLIMNILAGKQQIDNFFYVDPSIYPNDTAALQECCMMLPQDLLQVFFPDRMFNIKL